MYIFDYGFLTMCNLRSAIMLLVIFKSAFDTGGILSTPASDVYVRLKTTSRAVKIARKTTNNQSVKEI